MKINIDVIYALMIVIPFLFMGAFFAYEMATDH